MESVWKIPIPHKIQPGIGGSWTIPIKATRLCKICAILRQENETLIKKYKDNHKTLSYQGLGYFETSKIYANHLNIIL